MFSGGLVGTNTTESGPRKPYPINVDTLTLIPPIAGMLCASRRGTAASYPARNSRRIPPLATTSPCVLFGSRNRSVRGQTMKAMHGRKGGGVRLVGLSLGAAETSARSIRNALHLHLAQRQKPLEMAMAIPPRRALKRDAYGTRSPSLLRRGLGKSTRVRSVTLVIILPHSDVSSFSISDCGPGATSVAQGPHRALND